MNSIVEHELFRQAAWQQLTLMLNVSAWLSSPTIIRWHGVAADSRTTTVNSNNILLAFQAILHLAILVD